nr:MAG TPA: hypothetical protein [Caudoviricetes sp.]
MRENLASYFLFSSLHSFFHFLSCNPPVRRQAADKGCLLRTM